MNTRVTAQEIPRNLGQRIQNKGPQNRPHNRTHSTQDGSYDNLNRNSHAQGKRRVNVGQILGVKSSSQGSEKGTDRNGVNFVLEEVYPQGLGCVFILPDGRQIKPYFRPVNQKYNQDGEQHESVHDVIEGGLLVELKDKEGGVAGRNDDAHCATYEFPV